MNETAQETKAVGPAASGNPSEPLIRDILGGDDGKVLPVVEAMGDSLEKTITVPTGTQTATAQKTADSLSSISKPAEMPIAQSVSAASVPPSQSNVGSTEESTELQETSDKGEIDQKLEARVSEEPMNQPIPRPLQPSPQAKASFPPPLQSAAKNKNSDTARTAIRTLHSDIATSVRDNNVSLVSIALAQQEKNARLPFVAEEKKSFWSAWSIGAIMLVLGGVGVAIGAIVFVAQTNIPLPFIPNDGAAPTLIAVEAQTRLDITRMTRTEAFRQIYTFTDANYLSPVRIEALIITEIVGTSTEPTLVPVGRFFEFIGSRTPGALVRSVGPDMTLGRVGGTPFLITTAPSYENTFAGMLEWERFMAKDLEFIARKTTGNKQETTLQTNSNQQTETSNASEIETNELSSSTNYELGSDQETSGSINDQTATAVSDPVWKDIVVKNKDVRALIDQTGTPLILYTFPAEGLLVITQTREALAVIFDALNSPVFGG